MPTYLVEIESVDVGASGLDEQGLELWAAVGEPGEVAVFELPLTGRLSGERENAELGAGGGDAVGEIAPVCDARHVEQCR